MVVYTLNHRIASYGPPHVTRCGGFIFRSPTIKKCKQPICVRVDDRARTELLGNLDQVDTFDISFCVLNCNVEIVS